MIYLLEDDNNIRELVCYSLKKTGNSVLGFSTPHDFWHAMATELPTLILLDIMLPEEDGKSILKKLRSRTATFDIPVIMLTAKSDEFDVVSALDLGADDYITKPFGVMELVARVNAVLRRTGGNSQADKNTYTIGNLTVSVDSHQVIAGGKEITLTFKEFELLAFLCKNRGNVLTRDQILQNVWGYEFDGENRTVDVHIRTLRQKLGACGKNIETVRGIGYKIGE